MRNSIVDKKQQPILSQYETNRIRCSPSYLDLIYGTIHIIVFLGTIANVATGLQRVRNFFINLLIHILLIYLRLGSARCRKFLQNIKSRDQVKEYAKKMEQTEPSIVNSCVSTYVRKDDCCKKSKNISVKQARLKVTKCQDKSEGLENKLGYVQERVRLISHFRWYPADEVTNQAYDKIGQDAKSEFLQENSDAVLSTRDGSKINNMERLIFVSDTQSGFFSLGANTLFIIFGLGIIYDFIFFSRTGECNYFVNKLITGTESVQVTSTNVVQETVDYEKQQQQNVQEKVKQSEIQPQVNETQQEQLVGGQKDMKSQENVEQGMEAEQVKIQGQTEQ